MGLGIGLTFPVLSAAAVSSLPPERFGVGSAVNQTARQVGGAIGVAILVAIIGEPDSQSSALVAFQNMWLYCACMATLSGLIAIGLKRPVAQPAVVLAPVAQASVARAS
jgi:MFS family permease